MFSGLGPQCSFKDLLGQGPGYMAGYSTGSENDRPGIVLWSRSSFHINIWPAQTILRLVLHILPSFCFGVQGDQSCLWAGSQPRKSRISLSACHHGNMPALPPPKSSTIFSPKLRTSEWEGPPRSVDSSPSPVPSGETEARGRRDGSGGGYMLVKDLPLNISLPLPLLPLPQCPWGGVEV